MDPKKLPDLSEFRHAVDVQIRFNDIDILGHLNNTVYFSFYDTGKAYFFQDLRKGKMDWKRVECVIANIDCAYIQPIFFGDKIQVLTRCTGVSEKSFTLQQVLIDKETRQIKSAATTVMVSIDPDRMVSVEVSPDWKKTLLEN